MLGWRNILVLALLAGLLTSCGFRRKKYENPISKDTQQPDKVLYDRAVQDIERSRFEVARITLNTLINTYDTSEFMAKAKLAIADSWFREGGSHGLAQAEAEYKDFILFYPTLEEAAEAQEKVCMIHVKQMEKTDRDVKHAVRAEDECRQLLVQFPNSKFAPRAQQLLREIQEVIADSEFRVGAFYHTKGSNPAAANRLQSMVDQYPLYSQADDALWRLGDAYSKMGPRFRDSSGAAYARIVKEYPLSPLADQARKQLVSMELAVPEADPVAYARMKYEIENRTKPGTMSHMWGVFRKSPDVSAAAKSGQPAMTSLRPTIPVSVPPPPTGAAVSADVTVSTVGDTSALDTQPDARLNPPKPDGAKVEAPPEPLPANRQLTPKQKKQIEKQSKKINQK
ncbi:MAG: outer membrane protein assembly factor BamD [Bryobacterales bacterium]|nr:outer membrane protein assembly factor BamD [Bryobacterales bacterium]